MNITSPITSVKGIGEKTAQSFEKMNISTIEDVLFHFPRTYFRYANAVLVHEIENMQEGMTAIHAVVNKMPLSRNAVCKKCPAIWKRICFLWENGCEK